MKKKHHIATFVIIGLGVVVLLGLTVFFLLPRVQTVRVASQAVIETKEFLPRRKNLPSCPKDSMRPLSENERLYCK